MIINGRELQTDGFVLITLSGWSDAARLTRTVTALPDVMGVIPSARLTAAPREITVGLRAYCTSLSERIAVLHRLKDRLAGRLTVRFDDWTDRIVRCVATEPRVTSVHPDTVFSVATIEMAFTLIAYDGVSYDTEPRAVALSTAAASVVLGTLPTPPLIQWGGAWSAAASRTLTFRGATGTAVSTLTLTAPAAASLSSSEFLEIDCGRRYITKVDASGVRTNAYAWKSGGVWFACDPAYADRVTPRWPTLDVSAGSGLALYRNAYAL